MNREIGRICMVRSLIRLGARFTIRYVVIVIVIILLLIIIIIMILNMCYYMIELGIVLIVIV